MVEDLEWVEGGETAFRLYCMRKESIFNKQGDHQKRPIISKHFFPRGSIEINVQCKVAHKVLEECTSNQQLASY